MGVVIGVVSGKGGVGKTVLTLNLAAALQDMGYSTIVLEGNVTSPTSSIYLGYLPVERTLNRVLRGEISLDECVLQHPSGIRLVTTSLNVSELTDDFSRLSEVVEALKPRCDILFVDGAAGLGPEAIHAMEWADNVLIVTNPEIPSVIEALRAVRIVRGLNKKLVGVALNRYNPDKHQMTEQEVELILELPVVVRLPEDDLFSEATAAGVPLVKYKPGASTSVQLYQFAAKMVGTHWEPPKKGLKESIHQFIAKIGLDKIKLPIPAIKMPAVKLPVGGKPATPAQTKK